jgi:hypothetical protein
VTAFLHMVAGVVSRRARYRMALQAIEVVLENRDSTPEWVVSEIVRRALHEH